MLHGGWARPGLRADPLAAAAANGALLALSGRSRVSTSVVAGLKKKHKPKPKKQAAAKQEEVAAQDPVVAAPAPRINTSQFRIKTWKRLLKQVSVPTASIKTLRDIFSSDDHRTMR